MTKIAEKEEKKDLSISRSILRLAACSDLRSSILISLGAGKKSLGDLREIIGSSSTTAIHALRELEKGNLLIQDENKDYALTKIGDIVALKLIDFVQAIDVLKKYETFWLSHDLSDIPEHLLERIGELKESALIEAPAADVLKIFTEFVDMLKNSKEIRGVTSMFIPEFGSLLKELTIEKNVDVELVITKEIFEGIDKESLKEIFAHEGSKLKLYLMGEDLKVAFTVTDSLISFGLFNFDGTYDWNKDLIDTTEEGIKWGLDLFEWYRDLSKEIYL
ncbi:MAG: winged helix-turn-helix domain-containing protein [Methanocellales archaeon]|nr:winged helix-turn-helix domain-containing protein [Methanocellales archaeon]